MAVAAAHNVIIVVVVARSVVVIIQTAGTLAASGALTTRGIFVDQIVNSFVIVVGGVG